MARIRTVKPEFWEDEKIASVPHGARLLFIALWNMSDDAGRLRGATPLVHRKAFPYDLDAPVAEWLEALVTKGFVRRYMADGQTYLDIPNFLKHQVIKKPSPSKLPPYSPTIPPPLPPSYPTPTPLLPPGTGNREQGTGSKEQGTGTAGAGPPCGDGFEEFWTAYPKKVGKGAALKLWKRLAPGKVLRESILKAVQAQAQTTQWARDGGQFVPHPSTWLNQARWEDDPESLNGGRSATHQPSLARAHDTQPGKFDDPRFK